MNKAISGDSWVLLNRSAAETNDEGVLMTRPSVQLLSAVKENFSLFGLGYSSLKLISIPLAGNSHDRLAEGLSGTWEIGSAQCLNRDVFAAMLAPLKRSTKEDLAIVRTVHALASLASQSKASIKSYEKYSSLDKAHFTCFSDERYGFAWVPAELAKDLQPIDPQPKHELRITHSYVNLLTTKHAVLHAVGMSWLVDEENRKILNAMTTHGLAA